MSMAWDCFTRIDNVNRAQKMLDSLIERKWSKFVNRLAGEVNPHLGAAGGLGLIGYFRHAIKMYDKQGRALS